MGEHFIRTTTLEAIARKVLTQYDPFFINREPQAVPIEKIIEKIYRLDIDVVRLTMNGDELGRMICDNGYTTYFNTQKDDYDLLPVTAGKMLIEALLANDLEQHGRYRFTLAHELAHWILHKQFYVGTHIAAATYRTDKQSDDSEEWQANYLARYILLPAGQFKRAFYPLRNDKYNIKRLAELFEVSKEVIGYRLTELGLI
jgi:Zn-dependent peptidase ImmA (M78 family)